MLGPPLCVPIALTVASVYLLYKQGGFANLICLISFQTSLITVVTAFKETHFHQHSHGSAKHLPGSPRKGEEEEENFKTGDKLCGDSGQEL